MPRRTNTRAAAGSIRQRANGRWEARVTIGTDPGAGKPIRRCLYGDTQAAHSGHCSHCQRGGYQICAGHAWARQRQLYAERVRPYVRTDDERHRSADAGIL